ncbi:MAG: hypothetical protein AB1505_14090 [Candidatus Latescibacterota bacterium]
MSAEGRVDPRSASPRYAMSDDVRAIQDLILRFHEAWGRRDGEGSMACWGTHGFAIAGCGSDDPQQWRPLRAWVLEERQPPGEAPQPQPEPSSYRCAVEFRHVEVAHNLALVTTHETGTSFGGEPFAGRNLWLASKAAGEWRLLGVLYRDRSS